MSNELKAQYLSDILECNSELNLSKCLKFAENRYITKNILADLEQCEKYESNFSKWTCQTMLQELFKKSLKEN